LIGAGETMSEVINAAHRFGRMRAKAAQFRSYVRARCWFGHTWTRWIDMGTKNMFDPRLSTTLPFESYLVQERRCLGCNLVERRRERT
jgi:hypothetical protein